jgi:predicted Zn-dependent peptidase
MYYGPAKYESIQADISALHASPAEWQPTPTKKTFTPLEGKKTNVYFAQYDDMVQAQISWVKRSNLFDVDQMAMSSLHREYFGGGMSGVVFQTIRESKSLAYSSYSVFSTSNEKEKYNTVFSFIGTQSDKMKEAIIALNELHQKLPVAEGNFDRAKMAVISKMNTQRTTKSGLFWFNRSLMEMGLDSNYQASKYANVSATTMDDLISFHKKTYSETPFNYAILGDKSKLDMVYLKTLGPIVEVNLQTLFGY